jgi:hypothetical protein
MSDHPNSTKDNDFIEYTIDPDLLHSSTQLPSNYDSSSTPVYSNHDSSSTSLPPNTSSSSTLPPPPPPNNNNNPNKNKYNFVLPKIEGETAQDRNRRYNKEIYHVKKNASIQNHSSSSTSLPPNSSSSSTLLLPPPPGSNKIPNYTFVPSLLGLNEEQDLDVKYSENRTEYFRNYRQKKRNEVRAKIGNQIKGWRPTIPFTKKDFATKEEFYENRRKEYIKQKTNEEKRLLKKWDAEHPNNLTMSTTPTSTPTSLPILVQQTSSTTSIQSSSSLSTATIQSSLTTTSSTIKQTLGNEIAIKETIMRAVRADPEIIKLDIGLKNLKLWGIITDDERKRRLADAVIQEHDNIRENIKNAAKNDPYLIKINGELTNLYLYGSIDKNELERRRNEEVSKRTLEMAAQERLKKQYFNIVKIQEQLEQQTININNNMAIIEQQNTDITNNLARINNISKQTTNDRIRIENAKDELNKIKTVKKNCEKKL